MEKPAKDDTGRIDSPTSRSTVVRFSHTDAAGIMFYPRYFELLSHTFPDRPLGPTPFGMKTAYGKPNRLGDTVEIVCDEQDPTHGWSFSGRLNGQEHFSVHGLPSAAVQMAPDAHRLPATAFRAEPVEISAWLSDHTGCLQISRFFELVNFAVEQWFEQLLDLPFYELHMGRGYGIPTVEMTTYWRELPRVGDTVTMWVRPTNIGSRALTFTSWLVRGDDCMVANRQVIVFVKMTGDGFKTITIPEDIRARLEAQLVTAEQGPN